MRKKHTQAILDGFEITLEWVYYFFDCDQCVYDKEKRMFLGFVRHSPVMVSSTGKDNQLTWTFLDDSPEKREKIKAFLKKKLTEYQEDQEATAEFEERDNMLIESFYWRGQ